MRRYVPEFDGLRALAAIGVIAYHASRGLDHPARWMYSGMIGVRLFFVLSGFLITGILLDHVVNAVRRRDGLKAFYFRRIVRIFPAYYAFLIAFLLAGNAVVWSSIGWTAAYLSNFYFAFGAVGRAPLTHLWTLAVEEQFYLLWPAFVAVVARRPRLFVTLSIALILLSVGYRDVVQHLGATKAQILYPPFACLDSLVLGALGAFLLRQKGTGYRRAAAALRWTGLWVGIPWLLLGLWLPRFGLPALFDITTNGQAVVALASIGLILHFAGTPGAPRPRGGAFLRWPVLTYLGKISYGLYLYHFPLDRLVYAGWIREGTVEPGFWGRFLFVMATTTAIASLSWFLLEAPILRRKDRYPYPQPRPATDD